MRKETKLFLTVTMLLFLSSFSFGQTPIDVPDDYNILTGGTLLLNDFINGDTTATGERSTPDAVYVLKRGGAYFVGDPIENRYTLRVKASDGTDIKPIIYGTKRPSTGTYDDRIFSVRGDLYVDDLSVCTWSEFNPDEISLAPRRIIDVRSAGFSIYVNNCVFTAGGDAGIRVGSAAGVVKVTNTIIAQNGNIWDTNPGNGRAFDLRNVSIDSVIIQNCSLLDGTDRIVRHYSSVANINYFLYDHNTGYNWMAIHGGLGLGFVGDHVEITNNLFVDHYILGNDSTDADRLSEFGDTGEAGPSGAWNMTFVGTVPNDTTEWVVENNVYSVSAGIQAFYDSHADAGIGNLIPLTDHIKSKISNPDDAFVKEDGITFTLPTNSLINMAQWYWDPNGADHHKNQTGFSAEADYDRLPVEQYSDLSKFDLSYGTSAGAYTAANGYPAGDLNWYPDKKAAWIQDPTDVNDVAALPTEFTLDQNYPNPFNPSTKIVYNVPEQSRIQLEVFDILGRSVTTLVNEVQPAGKYTVNFDASQLSSGVYFYRLSTQNLTLSKKMILMK